MTQPKKWIGTKPAQCDLCGSNLQASPHFIDGRTKFGPWALMCPSCHAESGCGLGTGRGQAYDSKTLIKIGG